MIILHTFSRMRLREQQETWKALSKIRAQNRVIDIHVDGESGYDDALRRVWGKEDLIIVEQDIIPSVSMIRALESCVCDWCAYRYLIHYLNTHDPAYWVTHGLGLTKFSLALQRKFPLELWYHLGEWQWQNLDCRITGLMVQSGLAPHVHGVVKHNRVVDWTIEKGGHSMFKDRGNSKEGIGMGVMNMLSEKAHYHAHWTIRKFDTPDDVDGTKYSKCTPEQLLALGLKLSEVLEIDGNCLLNDGLNNILTPALIGGTYTPINTTDGCIGVGDSTTAAAASQTALQASTNHLWVIVTSTTGTGSSQQLVVQATFSTSQANWAWNEIMCGSTTTPGSLPANSTTPPATEHVLNRLVTGMGTKASTATWTVTLTITFS